MDKGSCSDPLSQTLTCLLCASFEIYIKKEVCCDETNQSLKNTCAYFQLWQAGRQTDLHLPIRERNK